MLKFPASLDRFAQLIGGFVLSGRGVAVTSCVFLAIVWALRSFVFPGTEADDSETLVHTQRWAWGYDGRNPPLFTWLVKLVQVATGPVVASVVLVKFSLLGGAYWLLFLGARRVLDDERLAALAALSPLAMYHIVWVTIFHLTHTAALAFSVALTFFALLRLEDGSRLRDYAFLGTACGLGLLSKYNYALFAVVFFAAACTDEYLRRRLIDRRILLTVALAGLLAAPHYLWFLQWIERDPTGFSNLLDERFALDYVASGYASWTRGLIDAPLAVLHFLLPCLLILAVLFPRAFWRPGSGPAPSARYRRVLGLTLLSLIVLVILAVGLLSVPRVKIHYMFVLILFPIFFFARVQAAGATERSLNLYAGTLMILAVIVIGAAVGKYFMDPERRSKARHNVPYPALADGLRAAGFDRGTILGDWFTYSIAGNLRPFFPESTLVDLRDWNHKLGETPAGSPWIPRPTLPDGQCLLVWTAGGNDRESIMRRSARLLFGITSLEGHAVGYVSAVMPPSGTRQVRLAYILIPSGAGTCR